MYLWAAAKDIHLDILNELVTKHGNDPNHIAKNGKSVMSYAARNSIKTLEVLDILIKAGCSVSICDKESDEDALAIYRANVRPPNPNVVFFLFSQGCHLPE